MGAYCYFETYIKGSTSDQTVFRADVHEAYRDVDIEVNAIWEKDTTGSTALQHEEDYQVFCFAEDDWKLQADNAVSNSPNFASPANPNKTPLSDVVSLKDAIGVQTTLDDSPPSFTLLQIQDPTAYNARIIVTFSLNEVGTAYCRATRSDSGETSGDMPINRILTANWSAEYSAGAVTIEMTNLENVDPALTVRDDEVASITEQTQYDVYCWAKDDAKNSFGYPRLNYMTQDYVSADIATPSSPNGGRTGAVWVVDSTPPTIIPVSIEPIAEDTVQVILQLNEPGTLWCAMALPDSSPATQYCKFGDYQESNAGASCYFETFIKGLVSDGTVFRADVHQSYLDYEIEVNRMWEKDQVGSAPLPAQTDFNVMCFAEDDWQIQASNAMVRSPNFNPPAGPNKVNLQTTLALRSAVSTKKTLDTTPPTIALGVSAPSTSETSLVVSITFNEAGSLYCLPLLKGTAAPHASRIVSYALQYVCSSAGGCSGGSLTIPDLLKGHEYDVHCFAEDDNTYPQTPNGIRAPVLTAQVNDITPPVIRIVRAEAPERSLIVVTLQLDEEGTVFCYCPNDIGDSVLVGTVVSFGTSTVVDTSDVGHNVQVHVRKYSTIEAPLVEQTAYVTYCAAKDTATNPDCAGCSVPNLSDLAEIRAARDSIGTLTTLDQSPPSFSQLGARGISETQLRVSFTLNEPGTTYCRATRSDAGELALHINHIIQASFLQEQNETAFGQLLELDIDRLANRVDEPFLESGTAYDIYCWAKDTAELTTCVPSGTTATCTTEATPNYMLQSYVSTRFSSTLFPPSTQATADGGSIEMVRTWDATPPNLIFVEAESRQETSLTMTLQLNEPGTAYCRAYPLTDPGVPSFPDVRAAPGGPFSFELPSDSAMRIYSAHAYRNFEITVEGLSREVLYFVYCAAEDDELADGCSQRDQSDDPSCTSNYNTPYLVEDSGRYTLDLTPPTLTVVNAVSTTQDSITVAVNLDEAGTAWCTAVLDQFPVPTINQVIAAGFQTEAEDAGIVNVTVVSLSRDTEYDVYCFARDDGTKSARNDTLEVQFSRKNPVSSSTVISTKTDAHVIYDSLAPLLLAMDPSNNAFQVDSPLNITLTFNEDVTAGDGSLFLRASGQSDVVVAAEDIAYINRVALIIIDVGAALGAGMTWRVIVPEGLVIDTAGNPFGGIDDGAYNLQT